MNRWTVGDVSIHRVEETQLPAEIGQWLLPNVDPQSISVNGHQTRTGGIASGTHSFAMTSQGRKIVVDTGIGNAKTRDNPAWDHLQTPYIERLTAAGFAPETVDLVLLTHLHADHVGWNTTWSDGEWVPTFSRATYVMSHAEREYWSTTDVEVARAVMIDDSVKPLEKRDMLSTPRIPPAGLDITSEVRLIPTPGHTPGHLSVLIHSEGQQAIISGDALHHSIQLEHPEINASVDINADQAASTRFKLLTWAAEEQILLLGSHFPAPSGGYVRAEGKKFHFDPRG
ncbi:MBL fold metallo-hydrolase [Kocuria sp. HSID16901]|uniref:MBL fold metallo-hydrolase n=1 Tax=Kocuria sp. HSID16901 TaxID=2419505 RepID=UPI000660414E|nr:MBL fold metallo-hydrolase [Kocuria sp. HSID16901]RUQ21739.1 MBL fold metallo-hydrolase [Kocuria sp. HSID16901]